MKHLLCEADDCNCFATHFDKDLIEFRCEQHRLPQEDATAIELDMLASVPSYTERFKEGREEF